MKKVTLVNFSIPFLEEDNETHFLPIEALNICANVEWKGYQVDFMDYQNYYRSKNNPFSEENIHMIFHSTSKIIIAVTTNEALPFTILMLGQIKQVYPEKQIILGGYGVNGAEEEILKSFSFLDIVVIKNCETCYASAIAYLAGEETEPWCCVYRTGNIIIRDDIVKEEISIDCMPLPSYEKVDLNNYEEVLLRTSTGCPFQCTFCQRKGKLVRRDLELVLEEIRLLRDTYGQKRFFFYDQTFIADRNRVMQFCKRLKEEKLTDIEWSCTGRVNLVNEELVKTMAESGCKMMYFGVESGSERVLKKIKKNISLQQVKMANELASKYVTVNNFIIWGFPFETMDDFEETMRLIAHLKQNSISPIVYMCSLFPATEICKEYRKNMFFSEECWQMNWSQQFISDIVREKIKEIIKQYPSVFSGFYIADTNIVKKLERIKELNFASHYPDV